MKALSIMSLLIWIPLYIMALIHIVRLKEGYDIELAKTAFWLWVSASFLIGLSLSNLLT